MAAVWFLAGAVVGAIAAMVCAMVGVAVVNAKAHTIPTQEPAPDRVDVEASNFVWVSYPAKDQERMH